MQRSHFCVSRKTKRKVKKTREGGGDRAERIELLERGGAHISSSDEVDHADPIYNEPYDHYADREGGAPDLGAPDVTVYDENIYIEPDDHPADREGGDRNLGAPDVTEYAEVDMVSDNQDQTMTMI